MVVCETVLLSASSKNADGWNAALKSSIDHLCKQEINVPEIYFSVVAGSDTDFVQFPKSCL